MVVVFYDLETTGINHKRRHAGVQILSIGAVTSNGYRFRTYMRPTCKISRSATAKHGLIFREDVDDLQRITDSQRMDAKDAIDGLEKFMAYLRRVSTGGRNKIILVAHNNFRFDAIVLSKNMAKFGIEFPAKVKIADSIKIMKHLEKKTGFDFEGSKSLDHCLTLLLDQSQSEPHDALNDAMDCRDITLKAVRKMGYAYINRYFKSWKNQDQMRNPN